MMESASPQLQKERTSCPEGWKPAKTLNIWRPPEIENGSCQMVWMSVTNKPKNNQRNSEVHHASYLEPDEMRTTFQQLSGLQQNNDQRLAPSTLHPKNDQSLQKI